MESRRPGGSRTAGVCLAVAVGLPVLAGCGADRTPTFPSQATTTTSTATQYQLSGQVTDENGQPIAGATVEIDRGPNGGGSGWIATRTNAKGEYTLTFDSRDGVGYVYALADGYEWDVQWVPSGAANRTQDLKLPSIRPIAAGGSTSVTVGPGSTLCTDLEDLWRLDGRCTIIRVESSAAGTLTVDVTPRGGSGPPLLFWATSGNYVGAPSRPSETSLSIPMGGGFYWIFVGVPEGTPAREFDVVTSVR